MLQGQSEAASDQLNEEEQLLVISRLHQVSQHAESCCHVNQQATGSFHRRMCPYSSQLTEASVKSPAHASLACVGAAVLLMAVKSLPYAFLCTHGMLR